MNMNVEKVSDDIMYLGYNVILKMNVVLAKKLKNGNRYPFYREYQYKSNKYIDTKDLITIRRTFDYFLSIENIMPDENGNKEYIVISIRDITYFRMKINEVCNLLTNGNLYALKNKKLIMRGHVNPVIIEGLPMSKFLKLEPIIIHYEDNDSSGIRMTLSTSAYVDIPIETFMGFAYNINNINMFLSAQIMANSIVPNTVGENMHTFEQEEYIENEGGLKVQTEGREIPAKNKKSFFDKMDEL